MKDVHSKISTLRAFGALMLREAKHRGKNANGVKLNGYADILHKL